MYFDTNTRRFKTNFKIVQKNVPKNCPKIVRKDWPKIVQKIIWKSKLDRFSP